VAVYRILNERVGSRTHGFPSGHDSMSGTKSLRQSAADCNRADVQVRFAAISSPSTGPPR
jgi:hypothetical protein